MRFSRGQSYRFATSQGNVIFQAWDGQHASAERIIAYCDSVQGVEPLRETVYEGPASKTELHAEQATGVIICDRSAKSSRYEEELKRGGGRLRL